MQWGQPANPKRYSKDLSTNQNCQERLSCSSDKRSNAKEPEPSSISATRQTQMEGTFKQKRQILHAYDDRTQVLHQVQCLAWSIKCISYLQTVHRVASFRSIHVDRHASKSDAGICIAEHELAANCLTAVFCSSRHTAAA